MYLSLRFWILPFFIFTLPFFALSQEQLSQINGLNCCYDVVDITEIEDVNYVLATDYRGATRIYQEDGINWELITEHVPHQGKWVLKQGFNKSENYFYILHQDTLKYYYPADQSWDSYRIPGSKGVFIPNLNGSSDCRTEFHVNKKGVTNWALDENDDWQLYFRNVIDQKVTDLFSGEITWNYHCRQVIVDEEHIYYNTYSGNSPENRIISHQITSGIEDTLIASDSILRLLNEHGQVFIKKGNIDYYITDGSASNTIKLDHNIDEFSSANIELRNKQWQLLITGNSHHLHILQYDLNGNFLERDSIFFTTTELYGVHSFQKTNYGKYVLAMFPNIYLYDTADQNLDKINPLISIDPIGYYFIIDEFLITIYTDYDVYEIHQTNLIIGAKKTISLPEVNNVYFAKSDEDKIYIIANHEDLDFGYSDSRLGSLLEYSIEDGLKESLLLDEYTYGLDEGKLRLTNNELFAINHDSIYIYETDGFELYYYADKVFDARSVEGDIFLLVNTKGGQSSHDSVAVIRFRKNGGDDISNKISQFSYFDHEFLDYNTASSSKLFFKNDFYFAYFDIENDSIKILSTPNDGYYLDVLTELENGKLLCNSGHSFWTFNPSNEEYQFLYTLPTSGYFNDYDFVELENHYLYFFDLDSTFHLFSTDKQTFELEQLIQLSDHSYYRADPIINCDQRALFGISYENESMVWTTDGTIKGTELINDQFNFTRTPEIAQNIPSIGSHYLNFYLDTDTALYYWDCMTNDFINAFEKPLAIEHYLPFEHQDWVIARNTSNALHLVLTNSNHKLVITDTLYPGNSGLPKDISPVYWEYDQPYLSVDSSIKYFRANLDNRGTELWKIHADSGLTRAADVNPGAYGSFPNHLRLIEDHIYFLAYTYEDGMQVWRLHKDSIGTTTSPNQFQTIQFTAAPNPTQDQLHLSALPRESCDVFLIDLSGKVLQQIRKPAGTTQQLLHLEKYTPGLYFLNIKEEKGNSGSVKIIKL